MILLASQTPAYAQAPEYQVKAAMLANFALFVDWPPTAFSRPDTPFVACVLGEDPFGPWLQHELGERVGTHPVVIRRLQDAQRARECHLVFISRSEQPRLAQVLSQLRTASVLSVSDIGEIGDFCREGGMVGFVMEGNKVRFDLNTGAAEKAGLNIDSKLKRVARSAACGEVR
jgi:hypothetical protein